MALLDDVGTYLTAQGVVSAGWTLAKSFTPPDPDQVIVLNEAGGLDPDQTPVTTHTFPSIQVKVRGAQFEYDAARAKLQDVFDALNDATISGYVYVFGRGDALPLGYDDNDRPQIAQNFDTMKVT